MSYWERHHARVTLQDQERGIEPVKDTRRHRYPFAIVWTPIHPITWCAPFVGHMGICDSRGICLDFTGGIGVEDLAFGTPTRYITLNPKHITNKALLDKSSGGGIGALAMVRSALRNGSGGGGSGDEGGLSLGDTEVGLGVGASDDEDSDSDTKNEAEAWDAAVLKASKMFETRLHCMVCGNDCHSHVAVALNLMGYGGFSWWNKVILAAWIFFGGRHTTWVSVATTWIGPALVALIVLVACL